jgi:hypothetical protein
MDRPFVVKREGVLRNLVQNRKSCYVFVQI